MAESLIFLDGVTKVFVTGKFQASPFFWSAYADPGMVAAWWEPSVSGFTGKYVVLGA
jgi:hypothetical protein